MLDLFPNAVVSLTFEQQRYAVEECDMVEVCLANVTEMLEAVITVSLTTVMDGSAVEGSQHFPNSYHPIVIHDLDILYTT